MNAKQWRKKGFIVLFRDGFVMMRSPEGNYYTSVNNNGKWMDKELDQFEKIIPNLTIIADFTDTAKLCYCSSLDDSTCDFCSRVRHAKNYI